MSRLKERYKVFYRLMSVFLVLAIFNTIYAPFIEAVPVEENNEFVISVKWNGSEQDPETYIYDSSHDEDRYVRLKISYENKEVKGSDYEPGEIVITVPGLKDAVRSGKNPQTAIAADPASSSSKIYDWSYTYSATANTYTFVNNKRIASNTTFKGSFEIIWEINSRTSKEGYEQDFQAKLLTAKGEQAESTTIKYIQKRSRDEFTLTQTLGALYAYEIPTQIIESGNYTDYKWVRYHINTIQNRNARDVEGNKTYKLWFLQGAVVNGLKKTGATKTIEGKVYECYESNGLSDVIVAYPNEEFEENATVKNYVELYGKYYEESETILLSELVGECNLTEFNLLRWAYPGVYPYTSSKMMYGTKSNYIMAHDDHCYRYGVIKSSDLENSRETYRVELAFSCGIDGALSADYYDVEFVDENLYIQTIDGSYRLLTDDEYNFKTITIPSYANIENKNMTADEFVKDGRYKVEVYIRRANLTDYELYETVMLTSRSQQFNVPDDTVGIKIIYREVQEYFLNVQTQATFTLHTTAKDILTDNGTLKNISRNTIYEQKDDNYIIYGEFDWDADLHIHEIPNIYSSTNKIVKSGEDRENLYFSGSVTSSFTLAEDNDLSRFSVYTIIPENLSLNEFYNTPETLIDVLTFSGNNLNPGFIKKHAQIEIIENYKDSGRTYIAIHFDFTDNPVITDGIVVSGIPMYVSKDKLDNFEFLSTMRAAVLIDQGGKWYTSSTDSSTMENRLWYDIDGDGDTLEPTSFSYASIKEIIPQSTHLELTKSVKTDNHPMYIQPTEDSDGTYIEDTIPSTYPEDEYSYKLRVRAGTNEGKNKNIIFVDALEAGVHAEWQGTFVRVDYSYAQEVYGVTPTIYYSSETVSREEKPDFTSSIWTTERPEIVKSVAVDFGEFELNEGKSLYIEIIMKSPSELGENKNKITENNSSVYFDTYTSEGLLMEENDCLISNDVPVRLVPYQGTIRITKTDATSGENLAGAEFSLYRKEQDGTRKLVAEHLVTDNSGIASIKVEYGDYYLVETKAPLAYVLNPDPIDVSLNADKPDIILNLTVRNPRKDGQLTVLKVSDHNSAAKLSGAVFSVYTADNVLVQENLVTGADGELVIKGLPWGSYYLLETQAPKGYIKSDQKYEFIIDVNNDAGRMISVTVINEQIPAMATLTKYEKLEDGTIADNPTPVDGAAYALYDIDDNLLGTYITDKNGKIYVEDLTFGKYYFLETIAAQGYNLYGSKIEFEVTAEHSETALAVTTYDQRKTGHVWMQKVDDKGQYVANAKYALFRQADNVRVDVTGQPSDICFTTDQEGIIEIEGIYWGNYYLQEIESPIGYDLNPEKYMFTVDRVSANKNYIIINAEDVRSTGCVELTKVAEENEETVLAGAVFTLYKSDGSIYRDNLTTNEDDKLLVEGIEWGSYYFLEKIAPEGYGLNTDKIRFSVNYLTAGKTQYLTVTDPLPECEITVTKKIAVDEIVFAHGNPTFIFKIEGTDIAGQTYVFHRMVTFSEDFLKSALQSDPDVQYIEQSITISGLPAGEWTVSEIAAIRYTEATWQTVEGEQIGTDTATYELSDTHRTAHVEFTNGKTVQSYTSHTSLETNIVSASKKITAMFAVWNGDESINTEVIDRTQLDVFAIYDDGSQIKLADDAYTLSPDSFEAGVSAEYTVTVTYSEDGKTFTDSFRLFVNAPNVFTTKLLTQTPFTEDGIEYAGTVAITGYTGTSSILKIPKSVIGLNELTNYGDGQSTGVTKYTDNGKTYKVVSIETTKAEYYKPIYGAKNIKELILPEGIETIGDRAFCSCQNLTGTLIIPDSVTTIGDSAFNYCYRLTNVVLGNGLKMIGENAFSLCSSLKNLEFGNSVQVIGAGAFNNCGLTGTLTIPDSVITISDKAFYFCEKLEGLVLGKNVETIGSDAFSYCFVLAGELIIPDSVTSIGESAFRSCSHLTGTLTIPDSVTTISNYTFSGCSGLTGTLTISNNVTTIGNYAFSGCSGLTDLELGNSVTTIGNYAFNGCSGLTGTLTIPDSVTTIGNNAFYYCTGLKGTLTIPNSVTTIGNYAFYYCTGLTDLEIGNSVTTIGDFAFYYCTGLTGLKIGNSVTAIGSSAFYGCSGLTGTLTIPDSVKTIGRFAFNGCSGLTDTLIIPDSVTIIDFYAFANCTGLTGLKIGNSVTTIEEYAFGGCNGLTGTLTIPDKVTTIGNTAFANCTDLTSIVLGDNVTTIGTDAFLNVPLVYYSGTATGSPWGALEVISD